MREQAKKRLMPVFWAIHRALPKQEVAVLRGLPDYEDNVLALEEGLRATQVKKTVMLVDSLATPRPNGLGPRTLVLDRGSVRGLFYFLTARYVFFTHSAYTLRFPPDVTSVYVAHGVPVKRVGWMTDAGPLVPLVKYALATSPLWVEIVQESFRPLVGTLLTGLPRNDRLFLSDGNIPERLGYAPESCRKLIVWLPTFRSARDGRTGGLRRTHSLGVPTESLDEINGLLESHQAVCVVKPHPLALHEDPPQLSHLRFITDDWLHEQRLTLYQLLGTSDALISDVSSVYVDYLILDRPIVHHFPDIREYDAARGYSLAPIEDYLAGPLTRDSNELLDALSAILEGTDSHAGVRRRLRSLFHTYTDGESTGRLLRQVGLG